MFEYANRARGFWTRARWAVLTAVLAAGQFFAAADVTWAKGKKEAPPEVQKKSYVLPYAVVILGVALGLIVVLRPAKRDNEPKKQDPTE